ncbi:hypothetical protein [Hoeflea halophila]|uniref:hypothetical protein n=1 Tax=Hoeflea halophila TaxID=714899 RepID=UPI00117A2ABD|nr:hypothetical protein [Hoeflea halophila]
MPPTRNDSRGSGFSARTALFALGALALFGFATATPAQTVHQIRTAAPVDKIIAEGEQVHVRAGGQVLKVVSCTAKSGLCLEPAAVFPVQDPAPGVALPDGRIATTISGDIRQAWFARPTQRYAHGVLGDAVEAGSLVAVSVSGRLVEAVLPDDQVFEDITPRIADLDGDGTNEVIAIRSSVAGGAAVAIYGLADGALQLRGAGTENGRPNRWLNIAGFMPRADGGYTLYGVRTPHIGGRLFSLDFRNGTVSERNDIATDLSNHIIGSRELGMSATGMFGGRVELVLPSQDRRRLRFPLSDRVDIPLPGSIDKAIALLAGRVITATEDGTLIIVSP